MDKKIRIGILSCANIAYKAILPSLMGMDNFIITGVASRNKNKSNKFAAEFNTKAFYNYNDLVKDEFINAIYIPLPNALHYEWVKKSLEHGKHVLVEKSMGCTLAEVKALNDLAQKNKLVLIENFQFRFHQQLDVIKKLINDNEIGELRCIRSSFGFPPFANNDNIRYQAELGGGALLDAGAYPIKISQEILGENLNVSSAKLFYDNGKKVDIWGGGFLEQNKGHLFSEIAFGFDNYYQCNIEIWGNKGKIFTNRIFTAPPGFETEIILDTNNESKNIKVADNHFKNMLSYFYNLIKNPELAIEEYSKNITQARLIEEFSILANGKQ